MMKTTTEVLNLVSALLGLVLIGTLLVFVWRSHLREKRSLEEHVKKMRELEENYRRMVGGEHRPSQPPPEN